MESIIKCSRCILSDDFPNIIFDVNGVCNYCHDWDKKWKNFDYASSETQLKKIIDAAKSKKRQYDCLVPLSGGRDSSYVLYLCKERYGLKPLAVTFNNLFMSDYAFRNILSITSLLDVDHVFVTHHPEKIKRFYSSMILNGGEFCSICTAGINHVITLYQRLFYIPLVISGISSRVDENSPFEVVTSHPKYVRKVLAKCKFNSEQVDSFLLKRQFELSAIEKIKMKIMDNDFTFINMPDYVHWNNIEIQDILEEKLGWESPNKNEDHIDCRFANMKSYLKNKQIPNYIFKQEKLSQLIRDGQMTREVALNELNSAIEKEHEEPHNIDDFLNFLNLTRAQIANEEKKSHLDYIKKTDTEISESLAFKVAALPWKLYKGFKNLKEHF